MSSTTKRLSCLLLLGMSACDPNSVTLPPPETKLSLGNKGGAQSSWTQTSAPHTDVSYHASEGLTAGLGASSVLKIQSGQTAEQPSIEATLFRAEVETTLAQLSEDGKTAVNASNEDPADMASYQSHLNDFRAVLSGHSFLYSYAPGEHSYDLTDADRQALTLRLYDHGRCSAFTPWSDVFSQLGSQVFFKFTCEALAAGADGARRDVFGAFPVLGRGAGPAALDDMFAMFGFFTVNIPVLADDRVAFFARYRLVASPGQDSPAAPSTLSVVTASGGRINSDNGDITAGLKSALEGELPQTLAAEINKRLTVRLPLVTSTGCPPGELVCEGTPVPCNPQAADPAAERAMCREKTTGGALQAILVAREKVKQDDLKKWFSDFRPSDYTCDADAASPQGGFCAFHIPVQRINVMPDGFEFVFRSNPNTSEHDAMDALSHAAKDGDPVRSYCNAARTNPDGNERQRPFTLQLEQTIDQTSSAGCGG